MYLYPDSIPCSPNRGLAFYEAASAVVEYRILVTMDAGTVAAWNYVCSERFFATALRCSLASTWARI